MADNFLITGYHGKPHVTSENDRGLNAATFGVGRFVLPVGEQFRAEYIGNNTIRMYDGKLMDNGAAAGIPAGEYMDLLIANAGQGMKRKDLIIFQYQRDSSTMVESGTFTVLTGTETSGTASDPTLTQADLLSGTAALDQMALWRVSVSGTAISAPVKVFDVAKSTKALGETIGALEGEIDALSGTVDTLSASVGSVETAVGNAAKKSTIVSKTLSASTWSGSAAPYEYNLSVSGVTTKSVVEILPGASITAAQLEMLQAANIQDGGQASGQIILKAYGDKPTASLPIRVIVRGDM